MLGHRLGRFFQRAFGQRAFDHLARHRAGRTLPRRARRAAGEHRVHVADAQALRDLAAQCTQAGRRQAGGARERRLLAGEQTILGLPAHLFGGRTGAHHALAQRAGEHRPQLWRQGHCPARHAGAADHLREGFSDSGSDGAWVLQHRFGRAQEAIGFPHLAVGRLLRRRIHRVQRVLGILESDARAFKGFAYMASSGNVEQAHGGLRQTHGAFQGDDAQVAGRAGQSALWGRSIKFAIERLES